MINQIIKKEGGYYIIKDIIRNAKTQYYLCFSDNYITTSIYHYDIVFLTLEKQLEIYNMFFKKYILLSDHLKNIPTEDKL